MHRILSLQASFHFPAYAEWDVESIIFQCLRVFLQAVSGLILLQGRKIGFITLQHIEIIEFPVSVVSTPTGTSNRKPDRPTWAQCPISQQQVQFMNDKFAVDIATRVQEFVKAQPQANAVEHQRAPLAPLDARLQRVLDQIPQSTQLEGLSLLDLQVRLRGRKGGLPHIGELGAAMRRLGWQRRRRWSDHDAAFAAKWYPKDPN